WPWSMEGRCPRKRERRRTRRGSVARIGQARARVDRSWGTVRWPWMRKGRNENAGARARLVRVSASWERRRRGTRDFSGLDASRLPTRELRRGARLAQSEGETRIHRGWEAAPCRDRTPRRANGTVVRNSSSSRAAPFSAEAP